MILEKKSFFEIQIRFFDLRPFQLSNFSQFNFKIFTSKAEIPKKIFLL